MVKIHTLKEIDSDDNYPRTIFQQSPKEDDREFKSCNDKINFDNIIKGLKFLDFKLIFLILLIITLIILSLAFSLIIRREKDRILDIKALDIKQLK